MSHPLSQFGQEFVLEILVGVIQENIDDGYPHEVLEIIRGFFPFLFLQGINDGRGNIGYPIGLEDIDSETRENHRPGIPCFFFEKGGQ
jgi:hypothetical protein